MSGKLCIHNDARDSRAYCEGRDAAAAGGDAGDNPFPSAPADQNPVAATGVVGDNNALTWTAEANDTFTVELVDPGEVSQALAVSVSGKVVTVSLATGVGGAITSTAAEVLAAVEADSPGAADLVGVADTGASTGAGVVVAEVAQSSPVVFASYYPAFDAWDAGFDSWAADPAGVSRDCCAAAYGGGYTP